MRRELVIDLGEFTGSQRVGALTSKERGASIRRELKLDKLDRGPEHVTVRVPDYVAAISSSFFLGLFSASLQAFPSEELFLKKYHFEVSDAVREQILNGIRNGLMRRGPLVN